MRRVNRLLSLLAFAFPCPGVAQAPPPPEVRAVGTTALRYVVQVPAGYMPERWVPVLVVFPAGTSEAGARAAVGAAASVAAAGFVVVAPVRGDAQGVPDLRPLFVELRRTFRIDQGGLHAAFGREVAYATSALLAHRHEFQTVTVFGRPQEADLAALQRLPARRVRTVLVDEGNPGPKRMLGEELPPHFTALHAERTLPGAAGEVARVLDDFHDAAANADEDRFFAILPEDAVFLGTDGTERWTGTEFRAFAMPYFQRESAWTYVPMRRHVNLEGDSVAWFDEVLDNASYGECRSSGVIAKRDGRWVLRQYNLTVSVPNDVAREVAARIRAFQDRAASGTTTVVLVRHAEKVDASEDPELADAGRQRAEALARTLRDLPITAIYTSQYRRTAATVAEVARARAIEPVRLPAADVAGLAARLRSEHRGHTVLACGHSNTIPAILKALGVSDAVTIADGEYDRLFVVTLSPDGARLLSLRYGP